jgi:hypothetical protein
MEDKLYDLEDQIKDLEKKIDKILEILKNNMKEL